MKKKKSNITLLFIVIIMAACAAPISPNSQSSSKDNPIIPLTSQPSMKNTTASSSCSSTNATQPFRSGMNLIIGTGPMGGSFYPIGSGLARILKLPDTRVDSKITNGSADNMNLLRTGIIDIAISSADLAYEISQGKNKDIEKVPACNIATLYSSFVYIIALEGSGINKVEDMKNKRVSVGEVGSSTEIIADRILEAAGLDAKKDIKRLNLQTFSNINAMSDKNIDAFFSWGSFSSNLIIELINYQSIKFKFIDGSQYVDKIVAIHGPIYSKVTLPKDAYKGLNQDVLGIGGSNVLLVSEDMNEQIAYNITKSIFDNLPEIQKMHIETKRFNLQSAVADSPLPYHPGAIKFYKEKGLMK